MSALNPYADGLYAFQCAFDLGENDVHRGSIAGGARASVYF